MLKRPVASWAQVHERHAQRARTPKVELDAQEDFAEAVGVTKSGLCMSEGAFPMDKLRSRPVGRPWWDWCVASAGCSEHLRRGILRQDAS